MQNQICFLLSYVKYGDNDAFLHCFSAQEGYQSFFAKGIYSTRNKKKPYLSPLNLLNISAVKRGNSQSALTISKLELAKDFEDFEEVKSNSILFFGAEFLQQILREERRNDMAFEMIEKFRSEIILKNYDAPVLLLFRFLSICGIAPLFSEETFLNPEAGIFEPEKSHPLFTEEISKLWKFFLNKNEPEIRLKRLQRNELIESLMCYYQMHFTGFYTPHSLLVLRQIFD